MADQADPGSNGTDGERAPVPTGLQDRLLDALVYLPAGIALTAADEVPRLVALGRDRLSGQVATARMVGDYAVRAGRSYVQARSGQLLHRPAVGRGTGSGGDPAPPAPTSERSRRPAAPVPGPTAAPRRATTPEPAGAGAPDVPPVSSLAIPGFDTLSASQVVQRLGGLSHDELLAVRAYEGGGRGRRTVLHRVDQLLAEQAS